MAMPEPVVTFRPAVDDEFGIDVDLEIRRQQKDEVVDGASIQNEHAIKRSDSAEVLSVKDTHTPIPLKDKHGPLIAGIFLVALVNKRSTQTNRIQRAERV